MDAKNMTSIEWLVDQMFRQGYFDGNKPLSFTDLDHLQHQAKEMYNQEMEKVVDDALTSYEIRWSDRIKQQNLYTEKEVRKAIYGNPKFIFGKDQAEAIIQSLKQPKTD
jgi:uncharacterized protein YdiU (UPF0061 family)